MAIQIQHIDTTARAETVMHTRVDAHDTIIARLLITQHDENYEAEAFFSALVRIDAEDNVATSYQLLSVEKDGFDEAFTAPKNAELIVTALLPAVIDFKQKYGFDSFTKVYARYQGRVYTPRVFDAETYEECAV